MGDSPEGPQGLSGEFLEFPGVSLGALLGRSWGGVLWASLDDSLGVLRGFFGGLLEAFPEGRREVSSDFSGGPRPSQGVLWGSLGGALEGAFGPS